MVKSSLGCPRPKLEADDNQCGCQQNEMGSCVQRCWWIHWKAARRPARIPWNLPGSACPFQTYREYQGGHHRGAAEFAARKLPENVPQKLSGVSSHASYVPACVIEQKKAEHTEPGREAPSPPAPPTARTGIRLAGKGETFQHHKQAMKRELVTAIPGMWKSEIRPPTFRKTIRNWPSKGRDIGTGRQGWWILFYKNASHIQDLRGKHVHDGEENGSHKKTLEMVRIVTEMKKH